MPLFNFLDSVPKVRSPWLRLPKKCGRGQKGWASLCILAGCFVRTIYGYFHHFYGHFEATLHGPVIVIDRGAILMEGTWSKMLSGRFQMLGKNMSQQSKIFRLGPLLRMSFVWEHSQISSCPSPSVVNWVFLTDKPEDYAQVRLHISVKLRIEFFKRSSILRRHKSNAIKIFECVGKCNGTLVHAMW